jgi:hypothetical protein
MKNLWPLIFIFISFTHYGQGVIYEKKFPLNHRSEKFTPESYAVSNEATGETALFVVDKNVIHGILFDSLLRQKNQMSTVRPEGNYTSFVGGVNSGNEYYLFFSDKDQTAFLSVSMDFITKGVKTRNMFIKDEKNAAIFIANNQLFVFTTTKDETTDLKAHVYDGELRHREKSYSFDDKMFSSLHNAKTVRKIIRLGITEIDAHSPASLELAVEPNKLYTFQKKIFLTIDRLDFATVIFEFDQENLDCKVSLHAYKFVNCAAGQRKDENSYFFRGRLFQINLCSSGMTLTIKDLLTNQILKEYSIYEEDELTFSNTPIMVSSSGPWNEERELTKTKKFLRKCSLSQVAVAAHPDKDNLIMTLGGVQNNSSTNPSMTPLTAAGSGGQPFSPVSTAYRYYSQTTSVFIRSKMTATTLDHIPGDLGPNAFDKIKEFKSMQSDLAMEAETVFRSTRGYILGYYNVRSQSYIMRLF